MFSLYLFDSIFLAGSLTATPTLICMYLSRIFSSARSIAIRIQVRSSFECPQQPTCPAVFPRLFDLSSLFDNPAPPDLQL